MYGMGIRTMFRKIVKICIASVLFLTGCSSKVSASSASITEKAKPGVNTTSEEKPVKNPDAAEKKEQSSDAETKAEEKKTDKKAKAKSEAAKKKNVKKDTSQSRKSTGTASAQASEPNNSKSAQQKATKKSSTPSSSKEQSASTSQHVHNWEYVKPTSHSEKRTVVDRDAWDETVIDIPEWDEPTEWIVCNGCGYKTQDRDEFMDHAAFSEASPGCGAYHIDTEYIYHPAVTHTVHHDAVTHEITVEVADGFGYYKCSCGATKEGW